VSRTTTLSGHIAWRAYGDCMRPGLQLVNDARVVRGWHGTVSGKAGEPGAHGHDGHDLYCMLHHINRKDQKEEGQSNLP
jgi:hypothetical protein